MSENTEGKSITPSAEMIISHLRGSLDRANLQAAENWAVVQQMGQMVEERDAALQDLAEQIVALNAQVDELTDKPDPALPTEG